jgi:Ras GTPase-activating-like protein IQGAP2/3
VHARAVERFDLAAALFAVSSDSVKQLEQLSKDEEALTNAREQLVAEARRNFILERELGEIDEKIKLLVKNRITVQDIMASQAGLQEPAKGQGAARESPLRNNRALYEELFTLLQNKPRYFASLARLVSNKDVPSFVQTVVFDMYGDQYDSREERLLLDLFRRMLQEEIAQSSSIGSLLRNNTAVTQMLSAYSRRGQGMLVLKDVLEEPLLEITGDKELDLEIDPPKVYQEMVRRLETSTGAKSDLSPEADAETAQRNPEVQRMLAERIEKLTQCADKILQRILRNAEAIPYGMRWISQQLGELSKQRFPTADRNQIGSLIGGYIYLRFFNPVIVTPDAVNFIKKKPTPKARRNLILIAKVLQNLSNGVLFGDKKEPYMRPLNPFIQAKQAAMQEFFERLVDVDALDDYLQVDKYMGQANRMSAITISCNQIFLVHALLSQHLGAVAPAEDDPVRAIVKRLGPAPEPLSVSENRTVNLQLIDGREQRVSTQTPDEFLPPQVHPIYMQARQLLVAVLRLLPHEVASATYDNSLLSFLNKQREESLARGDRTLADHVSKVTGMLTQLADIGSIQKLATPDATFNHFLWEVALEALSRKQRMRQVARRLRVVKQALKTTQTHHKYLSQRLELYKMYLENARKGGAQQAPASLKAQDSFSDKRRPREQKFTHTELEEKGVIVRVDQSVPASILKQAYYFFRMPSAGRFEITMHVKKGFEVALIKKPIVLLLDDLLKMQEKNETRLELDYIVLNVNLLVHLFNSKFLSAP